MRIVQVVPSLRVGGAERVAALLARWLREEGHESTVLSMYDPTGSWIEAELHGEGVEVEFLGKRRGPDPRMVPRIARALRRVRPEAVHTHLYVLKYALPGLIRLGRAVGVHTLHNLARMEIEAHGRLVHHVAFRMGVAPVAIGEAVAESVREVYHLEPAATVENGIRVADFQPRAGDREAMRAALGATDSVPVILSAGRLNAQKNHALLLDAFRSPELVGAALWIAGDGELRGSLEARARELGIADRVRFLGVRDDVARLMAAADAFVLSSTWEGNPLVVLEAMASGLPVVATAVGCVPELVSREAGRLVPPQDARALGAAMEAVVADLPAARAMGRAGARIAAARFDVAVMGRAYLDLYRRAGR